MMEQKKLDSLKDTLQQKVFTKKHLKQATAVVVVCAIIGGGAGWYHVQQKKAHRAEVAAARTSMIEAETTKNGLALLDTDTIKERAAQAIGKDSSTLTFAEVNLELPRQGGPDQKNPKEGKEHKGRERDRKGSPDQGGQQDRKDGTAGASTQAKQPQAPATTQAPAAQAGQPQAQAQPMHPLYAIRCKDGSVTYHILLDAVTGDPVRVSMS